jgi:hypothetical protein
MSVRHFSIDEVNVLVPKVAKHMNLVLQLHAHLRAVCRALVDDGVKISPESLARGERIEAEGRARLRVGHARGIHDAVRESMTAIEAMGGEIKDVELGLVDFRSWIDGLREVHLCWRVGETEVAWFHELDGGFSGRRSVVGHRFTAEPT